MMVRYNYVCTSTSGQLTPNDELTRSGSAMIREVARVRVCHT